MIRRRSVQKRLRRKIRSGKDKIVLRSLADMDIIKEKEVLFMNIETIKNAVLKLIDQYPISKVILFGSRANGTNRENSDIDLIMEFYAPVTLITLSSINIGELVKNLTSDLKDKYKQIPWKAVAGMRDITAHKYQTLRMEDVYNTIKFDFPVLKEQIENILQNEK